MPDMFYLVGLGNPGDQYKHTRHNVGRSYLEQLAAGAGYEWSKSKHANALYAYGSMVGADVELLLPETFMNKSGDTLAYVKDKHEAQPEQFIVLHDDVDLGIGEIKVSKGRGDGGNNGIKSIINRLGSKDFVRVRIGIAPRHWWTGEARRPAAGAPLERFVLQRFTRKESQQLLDLQPQITAAIESIIKKGPEGAMNEVN